MRACPAFVCYNHRDRDSRPTQEDRRRITHIPKVSVRGELSQENQENLVLKSREVEGTTLGNPGVALSAVEKGLWLFLSR